MDARGLLVGLLTAAVDSLGGSLMPVGVGELSETRARGLLSVRGPVERAIDEGQGADVRGA